MTNSVSTPAKNYPAYLSTFNGTYKKEKVLDKQEVGNSTLFTQEDIELFKREPVVGTPMPNFDLTEFEIDEDGALCNSDKTVIITGDNTYRAVTIKGENNVLEEYSDYDFDGIIDTYHYTIKDDDKNSFEYEEMRSYSDNEKLLVLMSRQTTKENTTIDSGICYDEYDGCFTNGTTYSNDKYCYTDYFSDGTIDKKIKK